MGDIKNKPAFKGLGSIGPVDPVRTKPDPDPDSVKLNLNTAINNLNMQNYFLK
jgi:hypothetical protein